MRLHCKKVIVASSFYVEIIVVKFLVEDRDGFVSRSSASR